MQEMLKLGRLAVFATDVVAVEDQTEREDNGQLRPAALIHFRGGGSDRVRGFPFLDLVKKIENARAVGFRDTLEDAADVQDAKDAAAAAENNPDPSREAPAGESLKPGA